MPVGYYGAEPEQPSLPDGAKVERVERETARAQVAGFGRAAEPPQEGDPQQGPLLGDGPNTARAAHRGAPGADVVRSPWHDRRSGPVSNVEAAFQASFQDAFAKAAYASSSLSRNRRQRPR